MLLDLLGYLATPCSWPVRSLGFLTSSLQVQARYRRCCRAWEPHLAHTRRVILAAAHRCPQQRKAVILGAGLLHDIPLRELAAMFREVILVDSSLVPKLQFGNGSVFATVLRRCSPG